ncbi:MAG: AzlD domain-containing protein [Salinisphaera sp.]|jgi:branched-subunit amino acid transport protein|nr:AzlD domain-containing protein [Salinisphaera sp.]
MTSGSWWLVVVLAALLSFGLRLCFIALIDTVELPTWLQAALRFVPVAVFSAMIAPLLVVNDHGGLDLRVGNLSLWAALVAAVVAWKTRNVLYTVIAGMCTLWGLIFITSL